MRTIILLLTLCAATVPQPQSDEAEAYRHYLRAVYYLESNRPEDSLREVRAALEADPQSGTIHATLGRVLLSLNREDEALEALQRAGELNPGNPEPPRLIGRINLQKASRSSQPQELVQKAEEYFRKATGADPDDIESLYYLALIYERTGRTEQAISTKRRLLNINPSLRDIWISLAANFSQMGNGEGELEALEEALKLNPDDPPLLRRAGSIARNLGKPKLAFLYFDQARESLTAYLQDNPDSPGILAQLAELCLRDTGQYDLAAQHYGRILETIGQDGDSAAMRLEAAVGKATALYYMEDYEAAAELLEQFEQPAATHSGASLAAMAISYAHTGRDAKALGVLDGLIERTADNEDLRQYVTRLRVQVLNVAGRADEAEQTMRELLRERPGDEETAFFLIQLLIDNRKYPEAGEALSGALERFAEDGRLLFLKALIEERSEKFISARATLEKLLAVEPDNDLALNFLGYMLADRGEDLRAAEEYLDRALELQPYQGSYLDSMGWLQFKRGDLEKAEEYLERAVRTRYRSAEVHEHLGYLNQALGREAEALREFRLSLANDLVDIKPTENVEAAIKRLEAKLLQEDR